MYNVLQTCFFDSFVCSGSACKNTCCSGLDIALDKETYDFYENSHGAFSKYVKKNIGQTDGKCFIKMTQKRECPFSMLKHSCEEVLKWIFEHTKVMEKHVYPEIEESIHPDVLTYALAFMVLV